MAGNSFGNLFRITTFGESHGKAIGAIIDGCPAGLKLDFDKIQYDLNRRKPGQSAIVTQRKEPDEFEILSGIMDGITTGTPLCIVVWNTNQKSKDYSHIKNLWRPSHADFTYEEKIWQERLSRWRKIFCTGDCSQSGYWCHCQTNIRKSWHKN